MLRPVPSPGIAAAYIAAGETPAAMTLDPMTFLRHPRHGGCDLCDAYRGTVCRRSSRAAGRAKAAFDAIPPAVLVSVIAPTALTTGWAEAIATAITAVAATRLPLLGDDRRRRRIGRVSTDVDLADTVRVAWSSHLRVSSSTSSGSAFRARWHDTRSSQAISDGVMSDVLHQAQVDGREGQRLEAEHLRSPPAIMRGSTRIRFSIRMP